MYVHTCDCCTSSSENERSVILSCKTAYRGKYWVTPLTYKYTGVHGRSGCLVSTFCWPFLKFSAGTVVLGGVKKKKKKTL